MTEQPITTGMCRRGAMAALVDLSLSPHRSEEYYPHEAAARARDKFNYRRLGHSFRLVGASLVGGAAGVS